MSFDVNKEFETYKSDYCLEVDKQTYFYALLEIQQFQAENERLRKALKEIQKYESDNFRTGIGYDRKVADIVHEALKEKKQEENPSRD